MMDVMQKTEGDDRLRLTFSCLQLDSFPPQNTPPNQQANPQTSQADTPTIPVDTEQQPP